MTFLGTRLHCAFLQGGIDIRRERRGIDATQADDEQQRHHWGDVREHVGDSSSGCRWDDLRQNRTEREKECVCDAAITGDD